MATARVLNDRYEMGSPLGKGGMAHVYRGTDRVLDRTVAIKVLSGKYAGDESFVARFRREAQAAAGLNHANIVGVYDTGDEGTMHYIVMEYVAGETLADVLRREGRLDPDRAGAIGAEVATALQAAHDSGLVHRDVKPGNVMIDRDGRVKVVDFGIARAAADDTLTQTGLVLGTASYLSPEQAQGLPVDARSDVYSLGCVLYQMLAGRPPFEADTPVSIAYMHVNEAPVPPREIDPSIPPHLDRAVMRALEKDPDARFPAAEAFRIALASGGQGTATVPIAAAGGDTDVLPPTAPEPVVAGPSRRRSWITVALVAAVVLAAIGAIALANREPGVSGREDGRQTDGQEQPPAEEPTTPAAPVEPALGVLNAVLTEAVNAEELTFDAAGTIADRADAAQEAWLAGDADKALEELSKAHEEVDKAFEDGEIASEETSAAIHEAISAVEGAVTASAPVEETPTVEEEGGDEGDGGPGNSENAPGHEKKDGKGNGEGDD